VSALAFDQAPRRVYWELTRACDLACRHCRAAAVRERSADELDTDECERVLDRLAGAGGPPPHVIFTGGDPLTRDDLPRLIASAVDRGLGASVAPTATPRLTRDTVQGLKRAGVSAMSLSIDGPSAAYHDGMRGVLGCFGWTLVTAERIVAAGIPLQVNTLVTADTEGQLDEIATLVGRLGASRWSLFFLVSVGRGRALRSPSAAGSERTLRWLARNARRWPFVTTTTEAPHFRRVLLQTARERGESTADVARRAGFGMRDGNGILFIGANGDVTPSGFLPLTAGNVRESDPLALYRDDPTFRALRRPELFGGRCGACEFRQICGGSRARAWAATGNVFAEDPLCAWQPTAAA
jgi:radical SAM protein with 4Fe4S-binding SPASM domain